MAQGSEERSEQIGARFAGYQVYDRHYEKIGRVEHLFVDQKDRLEYVGVKTGFFGNHSSLIPMGIVRVNDERRLMEVDSERVTIEQGPTFAGDEELTPELEHRVYAHFGLNRDGTYASRGGYGDHFAEQDHRSRTEAPSGVDTEYSECPDAPAFGAPNTQENYELRGRTEEVGATDAARRKAGELSIDLTQVEGTGSGGRIVIWDVTGFAEERESAAQFSPAPDGPEPDHPGKERRERDREVEGTTDPGMRMGDTESGEFRGHAPDDEGVGQRGSSDLEDKDELRVQRSEEEIRVGTREREAGSVNVSKRVRTERERVQVPKRREEVTVERVTISGEAAEGEIGEEEVRIPVVEEEVVVEKRPVVKEELRIRKDVVQDQQVVEEDLRKEEVDVIDETRRRGQSTKGK